MRDRPPKAVFGGSPMRFEVLTGVRLDRLLPTAVRPALHGQGAPGWMPELMADQWEGEGPWASGSRASVVGRRIEAAAATRR